MIPVVSQLLTQVGSTGAACSKLQQTSGSPSLEEDCKVVHNIEKFCPIKMQDIREV